MPDSERKASAALKLLFRIVINVGMAFFFQSTFPIFFVLQGGVKALVLVGITLAFLNWIVVPVLHILSLPIKLFAWIVAFFLVNMASLWLTVWFITALKIEGMSLAIQGGIVGWLVLSFFLGVGNWLVRAVLK